VGQALACFTHADEERSGPHRLALLVEAQKIQEISFSHQSYVICRALLDKIDGRKGKNLLGVVIVLRWTRSRSRRKRKMNTGFLCQAILLIVSLMLVAPPAPGQTVQKPLGDKENPLLIGDRDLNTDRINFLSLDREMAFGRQLAVEVDRVVKLVNDPLITDYVHRVGQNIVLYSDARMPFTTKVIDSDDISAFALPGGYLYVNRGMLEAADSEAELVGVMAHWIGHIAARHGLEQASELNLINYSLPELFSQDGSDYVSPGCSFGPPLAFLKFSRGAEAEADQLGAQYMWASGYDPQALVHFLEKLRLKEEAKPGTVSRLFSTHMMTDVRIAKVNRLVARFPDRLLFEPNSFEFSVVKARLMAIRAEKRPANTLNTRPRLKPR
jgi:predicted Zn-dependent protease